MLVPEKGTIASSASFRFFLRIGLGLTLAFLQFLLDLSQFFRFHVDDYEVADESERGKRLVERAEAQRGNLHGIIRDGRASTAQLSTAAKNPALPDAGLDAELFADPQPGTATVQEAR